MEPEPRGMTGLPPARILALADGIFAIAMTILVLDLRLPETTNPGDLTARLGDLLSPFATFVISFVVLGVFWFAHHQTWHFVVRVNRTLVWLSILFFMGAVLVPFVASVLGAYPSDPVALGLYGGAIGLLAVVGYAIWWYITGDRGLVVGGLDPALVRKVRKWIAVGPLVALVAIVLAFVSPLVSLMIYLALPVLFIVFNPWTATLNGSGRKSHDVEGDDISSRGQGPPLWPRDHGGPVRKRGHGGNKNAASFTPSPSISAGGTTMSRPSDDDRARDVRQYVFDHFVEHAIPPVLEQIMARFRLTRSEAFAVLQGLEASRHVKLVPGTQRILMAFPFSAVATPFRVERRSGRRYFANCAWDAVAFHAMLDEEIRIESRCHHCAEPIAIELAGGHATSSPPGALVYLSRPASEWWTDIVTTCSNHMVFFHSASHLDEWRAENPGPTGAALTVEQTHALSLPIYREKLKREYARPSKDALVGHFRALGLTGAFWRL